MDEPQHNAPDTLPSTQPPPDVHGATVVATAPSRIVSGLAETAVGCAASLQEGSSRASPTSTASFPGTTVLPRVELAGTELTLVAEGRHRYVEGKLLGSGGVGQVVEVVDNDIGRSVAVKRLLPDTQTPAALAMFAQEIRILGQLEHPNIVPIHDVGVDEVGRYYFVMKKVQGETLDSIIERLASGDELAHRAYSFEQRTRVFMGVLEAMQYAHAQGLLHRDVKPANIMVGAYGEVMLMDWGIAKKKDGGSSDGSLVGTPSYMSPEQARGETLDERSDVYSLCVVFYELLTLQHYLADRNSLPEILDGVMNFVPKHPSFVMSQHQSRVPADLGWIAMGGLQKDPTQRYASVTALLERLRRRMDGDIAIQCPATMMKGATYRWSRLIDAYPIVILSAILTGLVGVAALAIWMVVSTG